MLSFSLLRRAGSAGARRLVALAEIDTRSLTAFRMGLGLVVLLDAVTRARSAGTFLTDAGVLPRALALSLSSPLSPSLHLASGDVAFQYVLLAIMGAAGVAIAVGYRTRVALAVSLVLMISVANRNPAVHHTADQYVRVMLWWALVSPLARVCSWDETTRERSPAKVASFGTAGLLAQVLVVYGLSSWYKWHNLSYWWTEGSMLSYVLELDVYASRLGSALKDQPELLSTLTRASFALESFAPPVAFLAVGWPRLRTALVLSMMCFHAGTAALMEVGSFPLVSAVAWLAFLPGWCWDRVGIRRAWRGLEPARRHPLGRAGALVAALPAASLWVALVAALLPLGALASVRGGQLVERAAVFAGFTQDWAMFSAPGTDDGWLVVAGTFADGSQRDLLTGRAVSWERPRHIGARFPDDRWRTYLFRVTGTWYGDHRRHFAEYLCRRYGSGQNPVVDIDVTYMRVSTHVVSGHVIGELPAERVPRIRGECRDGGATFHVQLGRRSSPPPRPVKVTARGRLGL